MIDKHVFHAEVQGDQRGPDGAGLLQLHGCHGPPHRTASRSEANPRLTSVSDPDSEASGSGFGIRNQGHITRFKMVDHHKIILFF